MTGFIYLLSVDDAAVGAKKKLSVRNNKLYEVLTFQETLERLFFYVDSIWDSSFIHSILI